MEEQTKLVEADATKAELRQKISMIRERLNSICDGDYVEWSTAARFVEECTWWLYHPSGKPVQAPGYKSRLEGQDSDADSCAYGWDDDWAIKFGVIAFHVGLAISRCAEKLDRWLDDREKEGAVTASQLSELWLDFGRIVRGCVSNHAGQFYEEYSGRDEEFPDDMVIGTHSIDVRAFRMRFLLDTRVLACFEVEQLREAGLLSDAD